MFLVVLFLLLGPLWSWAGEGSYSQSLTVKLQPSQKSLHATAVLQFDGNWSSVPRIMLGEKAQIHQVLTNGREMDFVFNGGFIRIEEAGRSEDLEVLIEYSAVFKKAPPRRPVHDEDPSYGVAATITPDGSFLGAGAGWHPSIPGHKADFHVRIEAPAGIHAVTDGTRLSHSRKDSTTVSEWKTTLPRQTLALAAGAFVIDETRAGDIPVYTYFSEQNKGLSETYLEKCVGYIEMYEEMLTPYPFAKFAVVENFFPTGYGFPSWTLIGGTVLRLPFITETSLGHEIAHSWWGNGVHVDYASGNWSEGLTAYVAEHHYKELKSQGDAREYRLKILRDYASLATDGKGYPVIEFRSRKSAVDQAVGYGKVTMIFHMLRTRLGDNAFFEGLRHLAKNRMGLETSWEDIRSSFETVSNEDLSVFFNQWLTRDKGPKLSLTGIKNVRGKKGWTVSGTIVQKPPYYDLDVPLGLESRDGETISVQSLKGSEKSFSMTTTSPPQALRLDPQVQLFRELHAEEVPPLVNAIRGSDDLLVVAAERLPAAVREEARRLIAGLRQDVEIVPESRLSAKMLSDHDLLFLGWPERFAPALPPSLDIDEKGFSYDDTGYSGDGDALFAVLEHPLDEARAAAVYLPMTAEAAGGVNRKIPHYGKYSILVFQNGENVVKETWPTKPGPTLYLFEKEKTHAEQ
ncbi:MAG TPA: M1 family aminopeptidase [Desulfuromonadales bacterium]|nr:M1 family aminopeptidase [Desulfuromonadales bacterium]